MIRTTIAKDQFTDTKGYYIKELVIITRSYHDRIYIVYMGMNTKFKVDSHFSNAYLSFTSHFRRSCSVEILSSKIAEEYDSCKLSSSHILRKA